MYSRFPTIISEFSLLTAQYPIVQPHWNFIGQAHENEPTHWLVNCLSAKNNTNPPTRRSVGHFLIHPNQSKYNGTAPTHRWVILSCTGIRLSIPTVGLGRENVLLINTLVRFCLLPRVRLGQGRQPTDPPVGGVLLCLTDHMLGQVSFEHTVFDHMQSCQKKGKPPRPTPKKNIYIFRSWWCSDVSDVI